MENLARLGSFILVNVLKCIYENRWNNYFTQNDVNNVPFKVTVKELNGMRCRGNGGSLGALILRPCFDLC